MASETIQANEQPLSPRTMKSIADEMTEQLNQCNGHQMNARDGLDRSSNSDASSNASDESSVGSSYDSDSGSSNGSASSSSYSYESSSEEWSSSDESDSQRGHNLPQCRTPDQNAHPNITFRRRRKVDAQDPQPNNESSPAKKRNRVVSSHHDSRYKHSKKRTRSITQQIIHHISTSSKSSRVLYISFLFWALVQLYILTSSSLIYERVLSGIDYAEYLFETRGLSGREKKAWVRNRNRRSGRGWHNNRNDDGFDRYNTPEKMERLRQEAKLALGTAAEEDDFYVRQPGKPNTRRRRSNKSDEGGYTRTERLREGCAPLEWHEYHFPNCNEIHEIDLKSVVRKRRFGVDILHDETTNGGTNTTFPWGFVGNGLWRDVFSCDPHQEVDPSKDMAPVVLKMMKSEHAYDQRNFQRHRRDALVMELLSSSHHVVPIYGYCANTVLTQAISHTLDDVIYAREKESVKSWSPEGGYKTKPKIESWMGRDERGELVATRETESGRIRLALGVFRGLMDLHEGVGYKNREGEAIEWLPIIHADLQAKQYLVDSITGDIYLNDFNRCRFVTKKESNITSKSSLEACPVYIPTSPGSSRSPEEYDSSPLTEKLDVYSAGNILFGIITGERPWGDQRGKHIKSSIQRGDRPEINETIRNAAGTVDAELTRLLDRVYESDPTKRASAKEIVNELEKLLEAQ